MITIDMTAIKDGSADSPIKYIMTYKSYFLILALLFFTTIARAQYNQVNDFPQEEPVDGLNKEAILDGPDGTSTHAFTGSKDNVDVDLLDIDEMPKTAVRQPDAHFQHAVYVNIDKPASGEGEMDAIYSVWLADERAGTVIKVCVTNPMAELQWQKMNGKDAVNVPITQIASADKAYIAPGDVSKVIVEGCPDGRNIWTYIIDPYMGTDFLASSARSFINLSSIIFIIFAC